jgi:hypothetical protein
MNQFGGLFSAITILFAAYKFVENDVLKSSLNIDIL